LLLSSQNLRIPSTSKQANHESRQSKMSREVSHYVVTAHPPGGVLHTVKCNFLSSDSEVRFIPDCIQAADISGIFVFRRLEHRIDDFVAVLDEVQVSPRSFFTYTVYIFIEKGYCHWKITSIGN
jgi:hypothetical protein